MFDEFNQSSINLHLFEPCHHHHVSLEIVLFDDAEPNILSFLLTVRKVDVLDQPKQTESCDYRFSDCALFHPFEKYFLTRCLVIVR